MSIGATLPPKIPLEFEGRNIRTPKRSSSLNDLYLVQFEITREAWEALETVPKNAILGGFIWYSDGDPDDDDSPIDISIKPPRKKDAPKGEYGAYWNVLCKQGLFNMPDLQEAIRAEKGDAVTDYEQGLRDVFEVSSRTFIDPAAFESWLMKHSLSNIVTMSRQAAAKATQAG